MGTYPIPDLSEVHAAVAAAAPSGQDPISALIAALEQALHNAYPTYEQDYIDNVVVGAMLTSLTMGERLYLPMLDEVLFSKKNAFPQLFWGLLYDDWKPDPTLGTTVFLTGYGDRNQPSTQDPSPPHNLRKRIYASATTADLMPVYSQKIVPFWKTLLSPANAGQPLMAKYLASYFTELYWNLHVGVTGTDVPDYVEQIGQAFNTVLGYVTPLNPLVYQSYMTVRQLRGQLQDWINTQVQRLQQQGDPTTLVHYWLRNSDNGQDPNFRTIDITFECFHDFVALSQWGNTLYNTMKLLSVEDGNPTVQAEFQKAMTTPAQPGEPFDPLDRFIMEIFRWVNPNGASISSVTMPPVTNSPFEQDTLVFTSHAMTDMDPVHWTDATTFNPDRYLTAPLATQNDPARSAALGFASCPFEPETFGVADGRTVGLTNSIFGTVYPVVDGDAAAICDYAGYAPFGFGYRRCPGELLNVQVMRDLLTVVWGQKLVFHNLKPADPQKVPVGPMTVVEDVYGFSAS
jgi:cytochrome P450